MFNYRFYSSTFRLTRHFSTTKPKVVLDEHVCNELGNLKLNPRHHPGRLISNVISVPESLVNSIKNIVEDYPIKSLVEGSIILERHLQRRVRPFENAEMKKIDNDVREKVTSTQKNHYTTEECYLQGLEAVIKKKISEKLQNCISIHYDEYNVLLYLIARFAPEYAVLFKIFSEIQSKDQNFKPKSLFDFGSGLGTASWAAKHIWEQQIYEFFNVDSSSHMNELAQLLIQGGRATTQHNFKGIFYRQFLPATNIAYDLVVSAYTLLDLPSRKARLQTILNLWNKSVNYLVLVERGTKAGFEVINEARNFILNKIDKQEVYVFSPCPHEAICPRSVIDIPCKFQVSYFTLPIGTSSKSSKEKYSYLVLKKGIRNENSSKWPRLVEAPLVRSRHVICRLCTSQGDLSEVILTPARHGKMTYYCGKLSKWGDLLPINLLSETS